MNYKKKQVERGLEAVEMLRSFLEKKGGLLTVSVHENKYSSGSYGFPDLTFNEFGIEVKRVALLTKRKIENKDSFYNHIGRLKFNRESWKGLKEWCQNNGKKPMLVAVLTNGGQKPIFVYFYEPEIDLLEKEQQKNKWISLSFFDVLHRGEIWK